MGAEVSTQISSLMARFRTGDPQAAGELVDRMYPELRRIAAAKMHCERAGHSWSPTVLVNELYLELVKIKALRPAAEDSSERQAFLGLAGHLMRRLLIHHSRPLSRKADKITLSELDRGAIFQRNGIEELLQVEELLGRLNRIDPKFRTVVEMRVFEGRTTEEIATAMGCGTRTVATHWSFAKRWLESELDDEK